MIPPRKFVYESQRRNYSFLVKKFENQDRFTLVKPLLEKEECPFTFPILVKQEERDQIYKRCIRRGIQIRIYWMFLPQEILDNPTFKNSWNLSKRILCLPIHYELTTLQLEKIVEKVIAHD